MTGGAGAAGPFGPSRASLEGTASRLGGAGAGRVGHGGLGGRLGGRARGPAPTPAPPDSRPGGRAPATMPRTYRPRLVVDRSPAVRELVTAQRDFGRVVAVVLDRSRARVFAVDASGAYEIVGLPAVGGRGARFHGDGRGAPGALAPIGAVDVISRGVRLRLFVTPGSSCVGTLTMSGPLPCTSTHGPNHSIPFVKMFPFTTTWTRY